MTRMEVPVEFQDRPTNPVQRPATPMAALMSALPHHEPEDDSVSLLPLREAVADCLDALTERERFVLEATFCERITMRELGRRLGMSSSNAHRIKDQANTHMRLVCLANTVIQTYLGLAGTISPAVAVPSASPSPLGGTLDAGAA